LLLGRPLSAVVRLYVYALHGCLCEVAFTAVWDWCSTQDKRLAGHSSLWALPMYATAIYLIERLRGRLLAHHLPLPVRLVAYTGFIYLWEFSWGAGLRLLGACPWDYSGFRYNLGGLVTLEYAVPWAVAAFIAEQHTLKLNQKASQRLQKHRKSLQYIIILKLAVKKLQPRHSLWENTCKQC
uniref:Transmembrane protein 229B n=1 Tax=Dicentrarchus labrax TaxID=13489 RepID=A0A8C4DBH1_DICLA